MADAGALGNIQILVVDDSSTMRRILKVSLARCGFNNVDEAQNGLDGLAKAQQKEYGCVITDWWMEDAVDPDFPDLADNAYRVRAQVDVLMPGGVKTDAGPQAYADDSILASLARTDGLTRGELQRGARNVLGLVLALAPVIDARA